MKTLIVGQEFKSYRDLCRYLDESIKTGEAKQCQVKDWHRYFDWERDGNKIIITVVYDVPKEKIDLRKNHGGRRGNAGAKRKDFACYDADKELDDSKGVYKIQIGNSVYIGSTVQGFRSRFLRHNDGSMPYTKQLLLDGGIFKPIWIADDSADEKSIRDKEKYYMKKYCDDGFNVVNHRIEIID